MTAGKASSSHGKLQGTIAQNATILDMSAGPERSSKQKVIQTYVLILHRGYANIPVNVN